MCLFVSSLPFYALYTGHKALTWLYHGNHCENKNPFIFSSLIWCALRFFCSSYYVNEFHEPNDKQHNENSTIYENDKTTAFPPSFWLKSTHNKSPESIGWNHEQLFTPISNNCDEFKWLSRSARKKERERDALHCNAKLDLALYISMFGENTLKLNNYLNWYFLKVYILLRVRSMKSSLTHRNRMGNCSSSKVKWVIQDKCISEQNALCLFVHWLVRLESVIANENKCATAEMFIRHKVCIACEFFQINTGEKWINGLMLIFRTTE